MVTDENDIVGLTMQADTNAFKRLDAHGKRMVVAVYIV